MEVHVRLSPMLADFIRIRFEKFDGKRTRQDIVRELVEAGLSRDRNSGPCLIFSAFRDASKRRGEQQRSSPGEGTKGMCVRLAPEVIDQVDRWRLACVDKPARAPAVRMLAEHGRAALPELEPDERIFGLSLIKVRKSG